MTESEWLAATNPKLMLDFLKGKASDRQFRLFGCACCHRSWEYLKDECRAAVLVAERYADRAADDTERWGARGAAEIATDNSECEATIALNDTSVSFDTANFVSVTTAGQGYVFGQPGRNENDEKQFLTERIGHAGFLHDIFGNPFRPVSVRPSWLTSDIRILAEGIYADRAFDRMPILADALQDAGCDNEDVLRHCRQPGEHVRGCWAVDLLLGKE